jgi:hypothetical protein
MTGRGGHDHQRFGGWGGQRGRPDWRRGSERMPAPKGPGKPGDKSEPKRPGKSDKGGDRPKGSSDRNTDLEKRLDRLMQELEAIRKEIRRPSK